MSDESSRQKFEDWCKDSGHWYLSEDRQAFSVWSARDAENETLKARVGELEGRLAASRDMVVAREAKIAEMSDALWGGEQR